MKKIIAVIDAFNFSGDLLDSFMYIAREAKGELSVISLENLTAENVAAAATLPESGGFRYGQLLRESIEEQRKLHQEARERLTQSCNDRAISLKQYPASGKPLKEAIIESRFADLLLVSNTTSFAFLYDTDPPHFVKDVLAEAQCPVIVLPEQCSRIKDVIFAYNGTFSSMYAIRQFTQLFPEMYDIPVQAVYVEEGNSQAIPQERLLKDYLDHHYENVSYNVLKGEPAAEFMAMLIHRKDCLVTYGAYGRSKASRFFHRSNAQSILRTANIPLFITHP